MGRRSKTSGKLFTTINCFWLSIGSSFQLLYFFFVFAMIELFCICIFTLLILFHVIFYHKYHLPKYVKTIEKIPGPKGFIYFGNALQFYKLKPEGNITLCFFPKICKNFLCFYCMNIYCFNFLFLYLNIS